MSASRSIALLLSLIAASYAHGQQFQSFKDCVVGKRVSTNNGRKGTITRLDTAWSYCYVRFDDDGKEISYLYSLLNAENDSGKKPSLAVQTGVYECVTGGKYTAMLLRITDSRSYSTSEGGGAFHIETTGKIVFETGPMRQFHSKLLSEARIGLNNDGGTFYATSCELNRNKR